MGLSSHSDPRSPGIFRESLPKSGTAGTSRKKINNGARSVFGAFPFLKATRLSWFFTEIMEIKILRNMGRPTDNNADQGDWFISADEAREGQRQQDENEARIRRSSSGS